jgi:hypothetical protein
MQLAAPPRAAHRPSAADRADRQVRRRQACLGRAPLADLPHRVLTRKIKQEIAPAKRALGEAGADGTARPTGSGAVPMRGDWVRLRAGPRPGARAYAAGRRIPDAILHTRRANDAALLPLLISRGHAPSVSRTPAVSVPLLPPPPRPLLAAATTPTTIRTMTRTFRADRAQYAPASEAQDLSRMLDPTYMRRAASGSPASCASALPPTVYVDHAGDMHDPDFRPFPVLAAKPDPAHARRPSWDALFDVQPLLASPPPSAHEPEDAHPRYFFKALGARRTPPASDAGSRRPSFEEEYIYDEDEDESPSFPHTPEPDTGSHKHHIELR